jgi:hypothetical protein
MEYTILIAWESLEAMPVSSSYHTSETVNSRPDFSGGSYAGYGNRHAMFSLVWLHWSLGNVGYLDSPATDIAQQGLAGQGYHQMVKDLISRKR